jgi:hypothetical protein
MSHSALAACFNDATARVGRPIADPLEGPSPEPRCAARPDTRRHGFANANLRKVSSFPDATKGGAMYARVATFQSDPAHVDEAISMVRAEVAGDTPPGLEGARMLMLVDRESGKGLGVTLFDSQDAMRRGDEALNAMNPGSTERRTSVEFYEVPVHTVG